MKRFFGQDDDRVNLCKSKCLLCICVFVFVFLDGLWGNWFWIRLDKTVKLNWSFNMVKCNNQKHKRLRQFLHFTDKSTAIKDEKTMKKQSIASKREFLA